MSLVRLTSGSFVESGQINGEVPAQLDRRALLVYTGEFMSMDGAVTITEEQIQNLAENHNSLLAKAARMVQGGDIPLRFMPPIQLDHSTSATHTVGRLVGNLEVGYYVTEDDVQHIALYGNVRILGKENVERVADGRWTHLSIGADLESGKLSELTITPFPAAPEASLLSRNKVTETNGGSPMLKKLAEALKKLTAMKARLSEAKDEEGVKALSEVEEEITKASAEPVEEPKKEKLADMKKRHMAEIEEIKARHLAEANGAKAEEVKVKHAEQLQKLQDKHAEELKKLGIEAPSEDELATVPPVETDEAKAKMAAATTFTTRLTALKSSVEMARKKKDVMSRLSAVKASGKITPAELKKMDIKKLSAESQATINAVLKSYEDREPVIYGGLVGSAKAMGVAELSKERRIQRMMAEARKNMPMKAAELSARMAEGQGEAGEKEVNIHIDATPGGEHDVAMAEICGHMDKGEIPQAKEKLKHLVDSLTKRMAGDGAGQAGSENELVEEFKHMQNEVDALLKLAGTITG